MGLKARYRKSDLTSSGMNFYNLAQAVVQRSVPAHANVSARTRRTRGADMDVLQG